MQADSRAGTRVDGDHRPANRGERGAVTSQGYLTAGLAARIGEVQVALERLDEVSHEPAHRVVAGAVVTTEDEAGERRWVVLPGADGGVIDGVTAISARSPVGRALLGKEEGDEVALPGGEAVIVDID